MYLVLPLLLFHVLQHAVLRPPPRPPPPLDHWARHADVASVERVDHREDRFVLRGVVAKTEDLRVGDALMQARKLRLADAVRLLHTLAQLLDSVDGTTALWVLAAFFAATIP